MQTQDLIRFYEGFEEGERLTLGPGVLEFARTQAIVRRHLHASGARVLDIGGATGVHAAWLLDDGCHVRLIDPVPHHVRAAAEVFRSRGHDEANAEIGDARNLQFADASFDAVLLLGPIYHLTDEAARRLALTEAARVTRSGGTAFIAGISRYASLLDGLSRGLLKDPAFVRIVEQDLRSGLHQNPTNRPDYFTDAYFHKPEELASEVGAAGWDVVQTVAIEGPFWCSPEFLDLWNDTFVRAFVMDTLDRIDTEAAILGMTAHFLVVARKS
jgi:ubiquinone/menaquinone biosynthesis C-methylase UbiE